MFSLHLLQKVMVLQSFLAHTIDIISTIKINDLHCSKRQKEIIFSRSYSFVFHDGLFFRIDVSVRFGRKYL